jgi:DNA-binding transcriptional MerR regulator
MMDAEVFNFRRFVESDESDTGEAYEMETFKTISGDAEDNERLTTSYDTTLTGDALSEMQERHLKDAVDTWVRTIKKAYQYTGASRITTGDFKLSGGRLYIKDGTVELTDGTPGRYKAISELKMADGRGFPIQHIREMFQDLETHGRPLERAGFDVLRNGLQDVTSAVEAASSENTEQAVSDVRAAIERLPPNIVGVPTARYQNFLRQLRSYETILSRYEAQRADHLSKAAELERDLRTAERRLETTDFVNDVEAMEDLGKEIKMMREQRETHLAEAARFDVESRSQISQIRESVLSVFNVDTPLLTRIQNLFREQGITIATTITALGLIIDFIVSTIKKALAGLRPASQVQTSPPKKEAAGDDREPVQPAATAGTDHPMPATRYEEPELAVGGVGGAIN